MRQADWNRVVSAVSDAFAVHPQRITSRLRAKAYVEARAACYLVARSQFPGRASDGILGMLSHKDRSAVCYTRNKGLIWFDVDPEFRAKVQDSLKRLVATRAKQLREEAA